MRKLFTQGIVLLFLVFCLFLNATNKVEASEILNSTTTVSLDTYQTTGLPLPFFPNSDGLTHSPSAVIGPNYPGTNISMKIGDVLYSTKTLGGSSQIVGHAGIVNADFNIVHVSPVRDSNNINGGKNNSMAGYMNLHGTGETLKIYRPTNGYGVNAAKWATNNYSKIDNYFINPAAKLSTLNPNYCSKFIWQAFWYGEGYNIVNPGPNITDQHYTFVTPSAIPASSKFIYIGSFTTK